MWQQIKRYAYVGCLVFVFFLLTALTLETKVVAEEKFPTRPVELIVAAGPGGGMDLLARLLADAIEPFLGQKLVVINKGGGSGILAGTAVAKAKPDGYTLGLVGNAVLIFSPQVLKANYTPDDFSYITLLTKTPGLFGVRSDFPAKTAEEFFKYCRENPGKLTYTNDGIGGFVHVAGERAFHAMGVKLRPVPYTDAGASIIAFLGGHVDVYGGVFAPAIPHIKSGIMCPIFVSTRERIKALPEVVGVSDLGHPEAETFLWRGIVGPKGIPNNILSFYENAFRRAAQSDKVKDLLNKVSDEVVASSGKEFEELVRSDTAAIAVIAKEAGLVPR